MHFHFNLIVLNATNKANFTTYIQILFRFCIFVLYLLEKSTYRKTNILIKTLNLIL